MDEGNSDAEEGKSVQKHRESASQNRLGNDSLFPQPKPKPRAKVVKAVNAVKPRRNDSRASNPLILRNACSGTATATATPTPTPKGRATATAIATATGRGNGNKLASFDDDDENDE